MQTGSRATFNTMKPLQLSILLFFIPAVFQAQLTGLWMGKMNNDSNTVRKDDEYEIVLTEYKNKVYGYTRNTFFVDDNLFYIVKKVEGIINGDICEVEDAGVIMHNFPQKPERKVKVKYTFRRNPTDSTWNLDGEWKTNTTKKYYSISGKSDLSQERDLSKAKIFPHLEELNETKEIAFYNIWKKEKESAVASNDNSFKQEFLKTHIKAEQEKTYITKATDKREPAVNTANKTAQPLIEIKPGEKQTGIALERQSLNEKTTSGPRTVMINTSGKTSAAMTEQKVEEKKTAFASEKPEAANYKTISTKDPVVVNTNNKTSAELTAIKQEEKKTVITQEKQTAEPSYVNPVTGYIEENKKTVNVKSNPVMPAATSPAAVINTPATEFKKDETAYVAEKTNLPVLNSDAAKQVADREFYKPQEINFKSDSLVIALFDNGEVDGDTVSVLLNGEVIVAKQCLKTIAFKKTIYIPHGEYQANIVLYAENLGIYPPNTGLLVIYDGEERYNVRFSADLKKNAAIVLKRKLQ